MTLRDVLDELRFRAAANRAEVERSKREGLTVQQKVCERTAMELERLATWIELFGGEGIQRD